MAWLWFPAGLAGFFVFQFCLSLWEKHLIISYGPAMEDNEADFGAYLKRCDKAAAQLGLVERSVHRHLRFDLTSAFWFSPERDILVLSGEGKVAKMAAKQTWIYSLLADGRYLVTSDGFDEGDPSGLSKTSRVINASLGKLLEKHRLRLEAEICGILPFRDPDGAGAIEEMKHQQAQQLMQLGRATWVDLEQTKWHYTVTGAFCICGGFFKQLAVGITQFWRV